MPAGTVPTFVGREPELATLRAALSDAEAGRGRLVLVTGEPGLGKSTLVDAFAAQVAARDATVVWGVTWERGGAPAYWPWVQVLRSVAPDLHSPGGSNAGLAPLAKLVPGPVKPDGDPSGTEGERFALFDAVVRALELASRSGPLVIVIEDLHAAGLPSALLLKFVAQHTRGVPVLLLATYRDVEARLTPGLGEIISDLEKAGTVLPLPTMSAPEVLDLVTPVVGDVGPDLLATIMERTKGNPLFVAQVAQLLVRDFGERASQGRAAKRQLRRDRTRPRRHSGLRRPCSSGS